MKYTIDDAYNEVMNTIQNLKDNGIKIEMVVPNTTDNDYESRLKPELWRHVSFYPKSKIQRDLIYQNSIRLFDLGISFDTGHGGDRIDWEIDWSLHVSNDQEDIEGKIERVKVVEDVASVYFQPADIGV